MAVAFDTLKMARRPRQEAGFDERQVGILVDTFAEGMDETLATKADLEKTEASLLGELRVLKQRMTNRFGVMMVGFVTLVVAPIKLL